VIDGIIIKANPAFQKFFQDEHVIGKSIYNLVRREDHKIMRERIEKSLATMKAISQNSIYTVTPHNAEPFSVAVKSKPIYYMQRKALIVQALGNNDGI